MKSVEKHCLIGEYLQEQFICQDVDCEFCRVKIGRHVRTPETLDGVLRAKVLAPMLRPVTDPSDPNHYLKPEETMKAIVDKKLTVKDLEKEIPPLKGKGGKDPEFLADVDAYKNIAISGRLPMYVILQSVMIVGSFAVSFPSMLMEVRSTALVKNSKIEDGISCSSGRIMDMYVGLLLLKVSPI